MRTRWKASILVVALLVTATLAEAKKKEELFTCYPLNESLISQALAAGEAAKGRNCGLSLKDSAQGFSNAMAAMGNGRTGTTGFSLDVYTPFAWIVQKASWEAKKYKEMTVEQVTEEMCDPVLRVYANPDVPTRLTSDGMVGSSGVEHIIICSTKKKDSKCSNLSRPKKASNMAKTPSAPKLDFRLEATSTRTMSAGSRVSTRRASSSSSSLVPPAKRKFKVKTKHFKRLP